MATFEGISDDERTCVMARMLARERWPAYKSNPFDAQRKSKMNDRMLAVILAGATRRNPFRDAVGRHVVSLPLGRREAILDSWSRWLGRLQQSVDIVLATDQSTGDDLVVSRDSMHIVHDPLKWRGAAGVLDDLYRMIRRPYSCVLAIEGACLPPQGSHALLEAIQDGATVAVEASEDREPAGVFAITAAAFEYVPRIGYFDLKEQLLPRLHDNGHVVKCVEVTDQAIRVDSRESYLQAVDAWSRRQSGITDTHQANEGVSATWSGRAIGSCVIESAADVAVDAVLHESVVLDGARVERGAIVSRSVVTANGVVRAGETVTSKIVSADGERYRWALRGRGSSAAAGAIHAS